jgi:hypothetical protein
MGRPFDRSLTAIIGRVGTLQFMPVDFGGFLS